QYYSLGENRWKFADSWPPAGASEMDLFLASEGAGAAVGQGSLRSDGPMGNPDAYVVHPNGQGETAGKWGNVAAGPFQKTDQRADEAHALSYSTSPLGAPVDVTGPIALTLYAATSAIDTDWIAKLADVSPDGSSRLVATGYLRASHRALDGTRSEPLRPWHSHVATATGVPNEVYRYEIEIWPTSNVFAAGHRIRLDVTSMDLPNHEPPVFPAINTVMHDLEYPSVLRLSVLP
ncbi:MAG: CocE/NonD family hydrolase, partial [Acidobacteria bacterium]|nr:CocE/NonD family hydrolase [Acidobacteriota bacterium]